MTSQEKYLLRAFLVSRGVTDAIIDLTVNGATITTGAGVEKVVWDDSKELKDLVERATALMAAPSTTARNSKVLEWAQDAKELLRTGLLTKEQALKIEELLPLLAKVCLGIPLLPIQG